MCQSTITISLPENWRSRSYSETVRRRRLSATDSSPPTPPCAQNILGRRAGPMRNITALGSSSSPGNSSFSSGTRAFVLRYSVTSSDFMFLMFCISSWFFFLLLRYYTPAQLCSLFVRVISTCTATTLTFVHNHHFSPPRWRGAIQTRHDRSRRSTDRGSNKKK